MAVCLRGRKWWYNFSVNGKKYQGVCDGCGSREAALAVCAERKRLVEKAGDQKSVVALLENFREELSGGRPVLLSEAWSLAEGKPAGKASCARWTTMKAGCWRDFLGFMGDRYPQAEKLSEVTKAMAEAYIAYIRKNGRYVREIANRKGRAAYASQNRALSVRTMNEIQMVVAGVFEKLRDDAGLVDNPFGKIPRLAKSGENREAYSIEEIQKILKSDDDFCRPLFLVAICTGLREGDICNLRWKEVNLNKGMIYRVQGKTGNAVAIPIMAQLEQFLRGLPRDQEWVLPMQHDVYARGDGAVSRNVRRFLEGLGITTQRKVKGRDRAISVKDLHSCRHTFCWLAGQAGIPLPTVQSIVGHMSPEMTAHYAAHVSERQKRTQIEALSAVLPSASGSSSRNILLEVAGEVPDDMVDQAIALLRGLRHQ